MKDTTDTIEAMNKVRTDFRLRSCHFLMNMCNDIGDAISTCTDVNVKYRLKMAECRNALLLKVEGIHVDEQKDAENMKQIIRKNRAYRKIKFNENELKMLEEVVELKNDPNNQIISNKTKNKKQNKSFISRAGNEQNHKNYKEFVKAKHEEFSKKKKKKKSNANSSKVLPPITPRELENLTEIADNKAQTSEISNYKKRKPSRRFKIGECITLKSQIKELRKMKKIKLNDTNHCATKYNRYQTHKMCREQVYLPGQL
eukprot:821756_1